MRSPRSVTMAPIGMPWRTLNWAIDFLARRTAAFWPVMRDSSSAPVSMFVSPAVLGPAQALAAELRRAWTEILRATVAADRPVDRTKAADLLVRQHGAGAGLDHQQVLFQPELVVRASSDPAAS